MSAASQSELYEFRVRGELSDVTAAAFANFRATRGDGETILAGEVPDQSALFGVLGQIQALGIHLIEVRRAQPIPQQPPG